MAIPLKVLKKYDDCDLSGYSTKKLEKMIMDAEKQGAMICFPFKQECDPLYQDSPWHNDGCTVLMNLGSLGNECNIHNYAEKLSEKDLQELDSAYYKRRGINPPAVMKDNEKVIDPRYELKNHKDYQSWINFIMD